MFVFHRLVVFLRFLVDFLLLLGAARLCDHKIKLHSAALAAGMGAGYAWCCMIFGASVLTSNTSHLLCQIAMCLVAYGLRQQALRPGLLYLLLSLGMGVLATGLGSGKGGSVWLVAALMVGLCVIGMKSRRASRAYLPVSICHGDTQVELTALVDSGNTLLDPVTGSPVLVADSAVGAKLLGLSADQLRDPLNTLQSAGIRGLRLIPYSAVGTPKGMLLGLRVDRVVIGGRQRDHVVAFAPQTLDRGKKYQALTGGVV